MTTPDASVDTTEANKPPGPRLWLSIAVLVIGVIVAIGGLVQGIIKVVNNIDGPKAVAPATLHEHLTSGTWQIYVEEPDSSLGLPQVILPSQVVVTNAQGVQLATGPLPGGLTETLSTGSQSYLAQVRFRVPTSGQYVVNVTGPTGTRFLLSQSIGDVAKHAAIWFVMMGIGFLIGLIGVILLIVGVSRRRSFRRGPPIYAAGYGPGGWAGAPPQQPVATLPPPGWYPDPQLPGTQRYWDGARWTDHTHTP